MLGEQHLPLHVFNKLKLAKIVGFVKVAARPHRYQESRRENASRRIGQRQPPPRLPLPHVTEQAAVAVAALAVLWCEGIDGGDDARRGAGGGGAGEGVAQPRVRWRGELRREKHGEGHLEVEADEDV